MEGEFLAFSFERIWRSYEKGSRSQCYLTTIQWIKIPGFIPGKFDNVNQLLALIKRTAGPPQFSFIELKNSGKYEILFGKHKGITFLSKEIPSIFGFEGVPDSNGTHFGYRMNTTANKLMKSDVSKAYYGEPPADLLAGKHLIFLYANIIKYQYVVDAKMPLLRVIDSKPCPKMVVCAKLSPHWLTITD